MIILNLLFSVFENFGLDTDRAKRQSDIRLVESIIHNELRNARCIKFEEDLSADSNWDDCPGNEFTIEFVNGSFKYKGRKVTGEIFDEIIFKIINKNIFEMELIFKNENID